MTPALQMGKLGSRLCPLPSFRPPGPGDTKCPRTGDSTCEMPSVPLVTTESTQRAGRSTPGRGAHLQGGCCPAGVSISGDVKAWGGGQPVPPAGDTLRNLTCGQQTVEQPHRDWRPGDLPTPDSGQPGCPIRPRQGPRPCHQPAASTSRAGVRGGTVFLPCTRWRQVLTPA